MQEPGETKFFILQSLEDFLHEAGMGSTFSDVITFLLACGILILLIWLLDWIGSLVINTVIQRAVKRFHSRWGEFLMKRRFYNRLIQFIAVSILLATAEAIFAGFSTWVVQASMIIIQIAIVYFGVLVTNAFLSTVNDVYETKPQSKVKSIRSLVQSGKIIAVVVASILVLAIIIGRNPKELLLGLGASAAIVTLVFRDTILGFVASVQISAQEMIRPGDWIEMPSKGVDGMITEINVTNVKVRNWDNSVSMIPTYAMVSDSFTNWRNMLESDGRRFLRPLLIDIHSITVLEPQQVEHITSHPMIAPATARQMIELIKVGNHSPFITNLGLYRCYIEAYLHHHPRVATNLLRVVRYLPVNENGIAMQIYAFSIDKTLLDYERVISDVMDHILAVTPLFSLKFYQRPYSSPTAVPLSGTENAPAPQSS